MKFDKSNKRIYFSKHKFEFLFNLSFTIILLKIPSIAPKYIDLIVLKVTAPKLPDNEIIKDIKNTDIKVAFIIFIKLFLEGRCFFNFKKYFNITKL